MIIVTGGAGFVGSNLVHELNRQGETEILIVDNLQPAPGQAAPKFRNLWGAKFGDYMDKREFRAALAAGDFDRAKVRAILHQGACSNTLEDDGRYVMDNNFTYSKELLHYALRQDVAMVYASTAATYGASTEFKEEAKNERPLNVYGYSKLVFDDYVRARMKDFRTTVVGLRYFNVYGPRERHKGRMASVIHHFSKQLKQTGTIRMFVGSGGYGDGEQRRDFVFAKDLAQINMFFGGLLKDSPRKPVHAVVNAGTGQARTFKDVARALMAVHGEGKTEFIPFPADLAGRYQNFTQADLAGLRAAGYSGAFTTLEEGVRETFAEEPLED